MTTNVMKLSSWEDGVDLLDNMENIEENYGHYHVNITPEILKQMQEGKILAFVVNCKEYTVTLKLENK